MNMLFFYCLFIKAIVYDDQLVGQSREYLQRLDEQVQEVVGIPVYGNDRYHMISHQHQCVFIHINKNAGCSIERAFQWKLRDHTRPTDIIKEIGEEKWHRYFKFAVVRNPWDRLVSMYSAQKREKRTGTASFKEWIECSWKCNYGGNSKQDQFHQMTTDNKEICMDFLLRFESLQEDFKYVCDKIGVDLTLPHINKSDHQHYSNYYDEETIEFVRKWHKRDIEEFGYEYNCDGNVMRGEDDVCPDSQGPCVLLL